MINLSKMLRSASIGLAAAGFLLIAGNFTNVAAQRDPFMKASYMRSKNPASTGTAKPNPGPAAAPLYGPPPIESRIEFFKRQREAAVANGTPMPKITSVLTLGEMAVTGIFKTPRGYAAMVEATPIKLSYTIYPGEKFFDGLLVAVEENKLVFRKVTKTGPNKFIASVENKPLQQYTMRAQIEGTAPPQGTADKPLQTANAVPAPTVTPAPVAPSSFMSPLDEMNKQPVEPVKTNKDAKKPVKVAKNPKN